VEQSGFNKAWDSKDKSGGDFFDTFMMFCLVMLLLLIKATPWGNVRLLSQADIETVGGTKDKYFLAATFTVAHDAFGLR